MLFAKTRLPTEKLGKGSLKSQAPAPSIPRGARLGLGLLTKPLYSGAGRETVIGRSFAQQADFGKTNLFTYVPRTGKENQPLRSGPIIMLSRFL